MLIWDAAFASVCASEPQVAGRRKRSCSHFLENPCRNTPFGPRRKQVKQGFFRASCHLAGHVSLQDTVDHARAPQSCACCCTGSWPQIPMRCSLPPPPCRFLPLCCLASLNSSFAPGFPCCPKFCSRLPWSSIPIAPPCLPSPYGLRDLERCSPRTGCSPSSTTYLGKDHFPIIEKGHP